MTAWLRTVINRIHRLEDGLMTLALVTLVSLAFLQILLRNLFDTGIGWADPFLRTMILWVTLLGAMVATRENNHISIDLVSRYLNARFHPWINMITGLFSSGVCGVVCWYSLELVLVEYEDGFLAFGVIPVWLCQSILPIGFGVMSIRFFLRSAASLNRLLSNLIKGQNL